MSLLDNTGRFLTKEEIIKLSQTEQGKKEIFQYISRARSASAAQQVMERLGVVPTEDVQMDICLIIYETCYRIPVEHIMEYVDSMKEHIAEEIHYC